MKSKSSFHQSKEWQKISREHKTLRCYYCRSSTKDIQSDHVLPQSRYPMSRLWKANLVHACAPCNQAKGDKLKFNLITIKLLGVYYMIKGLINGLLMAFFAFALVVVFKDLQSGGLEASFSGQLLIEIGELIKWVWLELLDKVPDKQP
jgi:hypothetical protein